MDDFGLYVLSNILSFLSETAGCSFLITQQKWTRQILPLFRPRHLQPPKDGLRILTVDGGEAKKKEKKKKNRHKFVVAPVHDAATRLDRLNTRRWKKRKLPLTKNNNNKTTRQVASGEFQHPTAFPPLLQFHSPTVNNAFQPGITLLASYPRSGNTLLRSLLEGVTGLVTASDTRADRTLSKALAEQHDLVGEGLCLPPVTKTHWPERKGCSKFRAHRAILVVRNPFDAIVSYWNLAVTNTHTKKVTEEVYERFATFFRDLVRNEMVVWLQFLEFWVTRTEIPVLLVRYEDLIGNPRQELEKILNFYALGSSTDGRRISAAQVWKNRLDIVVANQGSLGYQRKSSTSQKLEQSNKASPSPLPKPNDSTTSNSAKPPKSSIGRSITTRYSPELLQEMHKLDRGGWLKRFGYHVFDQDFPNNLQDLPPLSQNSAAAIHHDNTSNQQGKTAAAAVAAATVLVNHPEMELRAPSSPYGRKMTDWRKKYTKNDTEPFPTVGSR
ncbi:unnamed protein product [Cylindrotheca closterium]|uniref:Sulfotransferase domain-containing protein n=1 Tax=Cylindrotheca closterium TaxID=2856 RepID=A0AAD2CIF7_9STRA|nr:unnamed protein product [Cylindrotheca closterium]